MINTTVKRETFGSDAESQWPPAEDLVVVDLLTGKTTSLPPIAKDENAYEANSEATEKPTPARLELKSVKPSASPSAVTERRKTARSHWLLVAVAVLAIGEGVFIASKLLRSSPQLPGISTTLPPTGTGTQISSVTTTATPLAPPPAADERKPEAPRVPDPQPTPRATTGSLLVRSDPAGARVWVDGKPHGEAPVTVQGLAPGTHAVILEGAGGRIQQTVIVEAGAKSTFVASVSEASGGIALTAPAELQVLEGGRLLGTSRAERILLETGKHTLDLVNETIGYQSRQVVDVTPGKITRLTVQFPNGILNINALPWAEVLLDGRRIGETPIGNLAVPAGSHEVAFRHPDFGEVKRRIDVTLLAPARLSVDLQRKDK
jgi:hypothetical protein